MSKSSEKRRQHAEKKYGVELGCQLHEEGRLRRQICAIHSSANQISQKAYWIVDQAKTLEAQKILETELCRAMARVADKHLRYAPYRGRITDG